MNNFKKYNLFILIFIYTCNMALENQNVIHDQLKAFFKNNF